MINSLLCDIKYAAKNNRILLTCIIGVCLFQFYRLFFGVDVTDESYYFTDIIRMIQGDRLFVDFWESLQTQGIFLLPFYYIYTLILGYDGLILFGRILFYVFSIITAVLFYFAVRKDFGRRGSACVSLIIIVYAPFLIYTISYNNLLYTLSMQGFLILHIGLNLSQEFNYEKCILLFVSGVIHSAMIASYPVSVVLIPSYMLLIFINYVFVEKKLFKTFTHIIKWYLFGMIIVAFCLLLYVSFGAGLDDFCLCISKVLDFNNTTQAINFGEYVDNFRTILIHTLFSYTYLKCVFLMLCAITFATIIAKVLSHFSKNVFNNRNYVLVFCCCLTIVLCYLYLCYNNINSGYVFLMLAAIIAFCVYYVFSKYIYQCVFIIEIVWVISCLLCCLLHVNKEIESSMLVIEIVAYISYMIPLTLLFPVKKNIVKKRWFYLLAMPSLLQTLVVAKFSGGYFWQARFSLIGATIFVISMLIMQAKELTSLLNINIFKENKLVYFPIFLVFVFTYIEYSFFYRDGVSMSEKNTVIKSGPGRWIYTSEFNAGIYDSIVKDMNEYAVNGGSLLVLENFPYAYGVLPSMRALTPNTWVATMYSRGAYTKDIYKSPVFDYFKYKNKEPDMIFYWGCSDFLENPDPNYKMHGYIIKNYKTVVRNEYYSIFLRGSMD